MSTWSGWAAAEGRTFPWAQVDVFAERAMEGNMLAIFTDARGLSDSEMQQLARETNLSETTFILPGDADEDRQLGVRVRIFTVEEELPFAGHPTLGTASWLWANYAPCRGSDEVRLRLKVGTVPVSFRAPVAGEPGVYGQMRQQDPEFGRSPEPADVAAACGLNLRDLHGSLLPQVVSTGLPFLIVPLATLDALARVRMRQPLIDRLLQGTGTKFVYLLVQNGANWRARMPFHGSDDPATGSAAGCAISYLVRAGAAASGTPYLIEQGVEVHRPSRLHVQAALHGGAVTDVFVGGRTIPVAAGLFTLL